MSTHESTRDSGHNSSRLSANELLELSRAAAENAYAPYSHFAVGAVVETDRGIFSGCNVENASYGLTICAERAALFAAVGAGAKRFYRLAVACVVAAEGTANVDLEPVSEGVILGSRMPCGACRQVIAEFLNEDSTVIVDGCGEWRVEDLLPRAFTLKSGS